MIAGLGWNLQDPVFHAAIQSSYHQYGASQEVIQDVNLKKITFPSGTIIFNTTDGTIIEYQGTAKPQKFSEIVINDKKQ